MNQLSSFKLSIIYFIVFILFSCSKVTDIKTEPLEPSNLTLRFDELNQIKLTWNDNSLDESGFKIERKDETQQYSLIATTKENITFFVDSSKLEPNNYTYRVYSFNNIGSSKTYSNEATIQKIGLATVTTRSISDTTFTTAVSGGVVTKDGGSPIISRGIIWSNQSLPAVSLSTKTTNGSGLGEFISNMTNLTHNTTYYVRAYAQNSIGVSYGNEISFKTVSYTLPIINSTKDIIDITNSTAISGGNILSDGGSKVLSRGVCWSEAPTPTISNSKSIDGEGIGSFTSSISGLKDNTTYYVRSYATNIVGTSYGPQISFKTLPISYNGVTIGAQVWMDRNLDITTYRNGDPIPEIKNYNEWINAKTGAWCYYSNNSENGKIYGKLYNFYAVNDPRGLAPLGWHIPTQSEFLQLINGLGGQQVAGGKLKSVDIWNAPNVGATNETKFSALPGGSRRLQNPPLDFQNLGNTSYFWVIAIIQNIGSPAMFYIPNGFPWVSSGPATISPTWGPNWGISVRCIKD